ncbi:hypothetical protein Nepgr_005705 [Nepenthes gracilis]|uniref:Uncharacterized protein n=1 Tax=Nepenthes gracilis TaxID=150966 RepID=A0AAD3S3U0_NEPGR|nr:hypothetical protein Nepgr_005705 [Nepenthes gracilis]
MKSKRGAKITAKKEAATGMGDGGCEAMGGESELSQWKEKWWAGVGFKSAKTESVFHQPAINCSCLATHLLLCQKDSSMATLAMDSCPDR